MVYRGNVIVIGITVSGVVAAQNAHALAVPHGVPHNENAGDDAAASARRAGG